jgi:hypothetical protein
MNAAVRSAPRCIGSPGRRMQVAQRSDSNLLRPLPGSEMSCR